MFEISKEYRVGCSAEVYKEEHVKLKKEEMIELVFQQTLGGGGGLRSAAICTIFTSSMI